MRPSTNPFDGPSTSNQQPMIYPTASGVELHASGFSGTSSRNDNKEDPLWQSRTIDWQLIQTVSPQLYARLINQSSNISSKGDPSQKNSFEQDTLEDSGEKGSSGGMASQLTGFLSRRVLGGGGGGGGSSGGDSLVNGLGNLSEEDRITRNMLSPKRACVTTGKNMIIAVLEAMPYSPNNAQGRSPTPLRVVSRWNLSRSSSSTANNNETVIYLPPPVVLSTAMNDTSIKGVFTDPTGSHTLVTAANGEAYYIHCSSTVAKKLQGFGVENSNTGSGGIHWQAGYITSVAWDQKKGTEGSTKNILLGTSTGGIYLTSFVSPVKENKSCSANKEEDVPVLLCELDSVGGGGILGGDSSAVTGLYFNRDAHDNYFCLAVTSGISRPTRLYKFIGNNKHLRDTFDNKELLVEGKDATKSNATTIPSFTELPGSIDKATLHICDKSFAIRTEHGIYYGSLSLNDAINIVDTGVISYLTMDVPVSIAITPYHFVSLSRDGEVCFFSRVSQKVIQRETIDTSFIQRLETAELIADRKKLDHVWLRLGRNLMHLSSPCEERDVWKLILCKLLDSCSNDVNNNNNNSSDNQHHLLQGYGSTAAAAAAGEKEDAEFDMARSLCKNTMQESIVDTVRGEFHLRRSRPVLAAQYFAKCPPSLCPFSTTALRLFLPTLGLDHLPSDGSELFSSNNAIIRYLTDKLRDAVLKDDKLKTSMLGAWLSELHLNENERSRGGSMTQKMVLASFLTHNAQYIDADTTIRVLISHDARAAECADYAAASGDIATAINAALSGHRGKKGALSALKILEKAPFDRAEKYYYRHAQALLTRAPRESIDNFLLRYNHGLKPTKLLPSLMTYERSGHHLITSSSSAGATRRNNKVLAATNNSNVANNAAVFQSQPLDSYYEGQSVNNRDGGVEVGISIPGLDDDRVEYDETAVLRYLEGVVKLRCESTAVHNYLISVFVSQEDEEPLFRFLTEYLAGAYSNDPDKKDGPLDLSYALRVVLKSGRHFRSAVKLYMGLGMRQQAVELALKVDSSLARELVKESGDIDEQKRLWLMIARNAAAEEHNTGQDVVSKIMSVIKECGPEVLSIEDVLPFLPDSVQIDQFKDEICEALTSYSNRIDQFSSEIDESIQTCEVLRGEISRLDALKTEIAPDTRCAITNQMVLVVGEPFYIFPSGFVILESALKRHVLPLLDGNQRNIFKKIDTEMIALRQQSSNNRKSELKKLERLQREIDVLVASECPFTGALMVDSIDKGFAV